MFTTQRTARGAALVASAAFGLGGTLAPATLAPASFVSAAHAQPHGATSSVNQPASRDTSVDVFIMGLIGQSGDYILINLGGVKSFDHVQVRLVAVTVDGSEIASMVVPSSQLTVSKNDDGYLDVSIHQRLNIEQVYLVEVTDFLTGESSFVELDPEYGESVEGLVVSRQNLFFPDTPGVQRAPINPVSPVPHPVVDPVPSEDVHEDRPQPTAAPAPAPVPVTSESTSPTPSAVASEKPGGAEEPRNPEPTPDTSAAPKPKGDRILVYDRSSDQIPAETREATLEISTAELRGSSDLQTIRTSVKNVGESSLGYDVMVFEMPADGGAVGAPLATTHVSPEQVKDGAFSADLKVPGTSLIGGKRYRVVAVGGDSPDELRLMATSAFSVSIIQRAGSADASADSNNQPKPILAYSSSEQLPDYSSSPSDASPSVADSLPARGVVGDVVPPIPSTEGVLNRAVLARSLAERAIPQAHAVSSNFVTGSNVTPVMSGYAAFIGGRTVVNLMGYQTSGGSTESVASPAVREGSRLGSDGFYTRGTKARGGSDSQSLEASASEDAPLPEGTVPLGIALAGSVVFVGSAVMVNQYRRRMEASIEAEAAETMDVSA
ncbi:propanediol dehydratase [Rothia mucilaginosa]|uniref:propanediol dehydratase n=1 Tax=Rothia mucilaginosa TaxID=43675 RepID=UPI0026EDF5BC|nr:propanediol dehydratase [Rothia mucilaginosa]